MAYVLLSYYDTEPIRNVLALLHEAYDRVHILYYPTEGAPSKADRQSLSRFIKAHFGFAPNFVRLRANTIEAFTQKFDALLRPNDTAEIDAAGGSSAFVAAAGMYLSAHPERSLSLLRYSPRTDRMQMHYPQAAAERSRRLTLSVPDRIALGGTFLTRGDKDGILVRSAQHDDELLRLWNAVKGKATAWNKFCMLRAPEASDVWQRRIATVEEKKTATAIVPLLERAGLIGGVAYKVENGRERLSFVPLLLGENLELLQKAGSALERYAYLCAVDSGLFDDVRTGVEIDWDGAPGTGADNPYNEIDLVMTFRNLIAFASCKNREPNKEDLYEISVLTNHFGGRYAVPMLLSTLPAPAPVAERAKEMGVFVIDNIKARDAQSTAARFSEMVRKSERE